MSHSATTATTSAPITHSQKPALEPVAVGRYINSQGKDCLLAFSKPELDRADIFYRERLGTMHFNSGAQFLLVSLFDEVYQFAPFRQSLNIMGHVLLCSDASYFDAARLESSLRRYPVVAVLGVNQAVLKGLKDAGHSLANIFAGRTVWARTDAVDELRELPNVTVRVWMEIGPAMAMECALGEGAHIDRIEWQVDSVNDEIVLSSRLARSEHFEHYGTGIRGRIDYQACGCGSADPRIHLLAD